MNVLKTLLIVLKSLLSQKLANFAKTVRVANNGGKNNRKNHVMKAQENPFNRPESSTPIYVVGTAGNLPIPSSPAPETGAKKSNQVPLVYTIPEAAAVLNVSTKTIRRLLDRGFLTSSSALRKKLIPRPQIEAFLKATCQTPKTFN